MLSVHTVQPELIKAFVVASGGSVVSLNVVEAWTAFMLSDGASGTYPADIEMSWLKAKGATGSNLPDLWDSLLDAQSVVGDTFGDRMRTYFSGSAGPDVTGPLLVSAVGNEDELTLTFNESLEGSDFSGITISGGHSLDDFLIASNTITATIDPALDIAESVTVSIADGGAITDAAENPIQEVTDETVTNNTADTVAPEITAAEVDGSDLELTFTENLIGSNFSAITLDGGFALSAQSISTNTITATVTPAATASDSLTLDIAGGGGITDAALNPIASESNFAVTNNTPGGFVPSDVSGLQLWLRAGTGYFQDAGTTPAGNGNPVGQWNDQSGNSRHASASSGARPSLVTNALNGQAVVEFDGSSDFFNLPDFLSGNSAGEIFVVIKIDADPPPSDPQSGFWTFSLTSATPGVPSAHFPYTDGVVYESFGSTARKNVGNPTPSLASWRLYNIWSAASDYAINIDGSSFFSTVTNAVEFSATLKIGQSADPTYFLDGRIAEVIIYDHKLTGGDRDSVESYIADKFGLTIA